MLTTKPENFLTCDDNTVDRLLGTMYRTACVNCKDCEYSVKVDELGGDLRMREYWCKAWGPMQLVRPDDFCSKGRRRKDV